MAARDADAFVSSLTASGIWCVRVGRVPSRGARLPKESISQGLRKDQDGQLVIALRGGVRVPVPRPPPGASTELWPASPSIPPSVLPPSTPMTTQPVVPLPGALAAPTLAASVTRHQTRQSTLFGPKALEPNRAVSAPRRSRTCSISD
jgi:hypothetical protein